MRPFRNILWVFDQNAGTAALEWVAAIAKHPPTQCTVVEVMEPAPGAAPPPRSSVPNGGSDDLVGPTIEHEPRRLEQAADALRAHGIHPDIRVLHGIPHLEIARQVLHGGHDLLIVSAQGKLGMRQQLAESAVLHLRAQLPMPRVDAQSGARPTAQRNTRCPGLGGGLGGPEPRGAGHCLWLDAGGTLARFTYSTPPPAITRACREPAPSPSNGVVGSRLWTSAGRTARRRTGVVRRLAP